MLKQFTRRILQAKKLLAVVCISAPLCAVAQSASPVDDYRRLIAVQGGVESSGADLFGDQVDLYTGQLSIQQTDIDLPGNNALPVRLTRRFIFADADDWGKGQFGDWELEIPRITGIFSMFGGWTRGLAGAANFKRCSEFGPPPSMTGTGGGSFPAHEYWFGTHLEIGGNREELLERYPDTSAPSDGNAWPVTTRSGVSIRCLSALAATSEAQSKGEGFLALTPDGTSYYFDHMVSRPFPSLTKTDPVGGVGPSGAVRNAAVASGAGAVVLSLNEAYTLHRAVYSLYPSKIVDRFGNSVQFVWNPAAPAQLLEIRASDGRAITFQHVNGTEAGIRSASDGRRTWRYEYQTGLARVVLPDNTAWSMNLYGLSSLRPSHQAADCDSYVSVLRGAGTGSIVHPNGAELAITTTGHTFGRTWVPRSCWGGINDGNGEGLYAVMPRSIPSAVVTQRTIRGAGIPAGGYVWAYAWSEPKSCWDPNGVLTVPVSAGRCGTTTDTTRSVTVTRPEGWQDRYVFGTRFETDEGLLLKVERGVRNGIPLATEWRTYAASTQGPYPATIGRSYQYRSDGIMATRYQPLKERLQQVGSDAFQWEAVAFDRRARPVQVTRSSESDAVNEYTVWHDDEKRWVLGQIASVRNAESGIYLQQTSFDAASRPEQLRENGRLVESRSYHADGTVSGRADGGGNWTKFVDWYRGIPRRITFADGTSRSAEVTSEGWISSTKDELGSVSRYEHDDMGRIIRITPASSVPARNATVRSFSLVSASASGLDAAYWTQTDTRGNWKRSVWYDALLRPMGEKEQDSSIAGSARVKRREFDSTGNVVFESFPATTLTSMGTRSSFDGIGRVEQSEQDSELGALITRYQYLPGAKLRVTDPRGNATTTTYRFLDTPAYDQPILVERPEGARTRIVRDVLGQPRRIERENY